MSRLLQAALPLQRAQAFAKRFGLRRPVLMAPMAGASPVSLAVAVARAGGMGAVGALLHTPSAIGRWVAEYREQTTGPLQINLWVPDPTPKRDAEHESKLRLFLADFGPAVSETAGDATPPDFDAQFDAAVVAQPAVLSTIMGLLTPAQVQRLHAAGVAWFATVTTPAEARQAQAAGADVVVAQGSEAGGHRGSFSADDGAVKATGLFGLLPQVVDAVRIPVVATGGIADGRGVAAALMLGASAVQVGTALLGSPQAAISPAWAAALPHLGPGDTALTRAFSGRWGRAIQNHYVRCAAEPSAPAPAPYPVQRGLTASMRAQAEREGDLRTMQAWAGQAAALARTGESADAFVRRVWLQARKLLNTA